MEGQLIQAVGGLALFVGIWCGTCLGLAYAGGWQALARVYPLAAAGAQRAAADVRRQIEAVRDEILSERGRRAQRESLHRLERQLGMRVVVLSFTRIPTTSVRISYGLAQKLAGESRGSFELPLASRDQDRQPVR